MRPTRIPSGGQDTHCIAVISQQDALTDRGSLRSARLYTCRALYTLAPLPPASLQEATDRRIQAACRTYRTSPILATSGHTSSRSRVSPAESLASLLRSPSSGRQHRLCCQRLQGRPLVWLISQSQTFRAPRNGTAQEAIPRYAIAQFDATLLSAVVQESGRPPNILPCY